MRLMRCDICGGFYEGETCPNQAYHPVVPPSFTIGQVVSYKWPGGDMIPCMVTSLADEAGTIGLMILSTNTRVTPEEIT